MQPVGKGVIKEINTHKQGRAGSKVEMKPGPVTAGIKHNPTKSGGINRATKS